jgi:O-antigen/teichoic acid export membrane protein
MKQNKTAKSFLFSFLEKCSTQIISFVISIVLARILMPDVYGVIALVTIFITFADVFVTYGFGNSLIVKKDADSEDYSSCLYASIIFSIVL